MKYHRLPIQRVLHVKFHTVARFLGPLESGHGIFGRLGGAVMQPSMGKEFSGKSRYVPLAGGLALSAQITKARMMMASNVAFASAFESVLMTISEEYAKWPW